MFHRQRPPHQLAAAAITTCVVLAACVTGGHAGIAGSWTKPDRPLRICVLDSSPVVFARTPLADGTVLSAGEASQKLAGMGVDLIEAVFDQILQWDYNVTYFKPGVTGFSQTMYKIRKGLGCDVGVQSFFITASRDLCTPACSDVPNGTVLTADSQYEQYICCIDFSFPYYTGGWSLMSAVSSGTDIDYIAVFFQKDIVHAMAVCVICVFFTAHLIWLIERTQFGTTILLTNPKEGFSRLYLDGLKDGMWFTTSTLMNGVVNSEKTILTPLGRLITTVWVLFGILISAFITSVISSTLTTNQLNAAQMLTAADVAGKRVCMSSGFFEDFFDSNFPGVGVQKVLVPDIHECYPKIMTGEVDAVFDVREEALGYFIAGHGAGLLISPVLKPQGYGMVWSQAWTHASTVNEALLLYQQNSIATSPPYSDSANRWYYGDANQIAYGGSAAPEGKKWNWALLGTAIALVAAYLCLQGFVWMAHKYVVPQAAGGPSGDATMAGRSNSLSGSSHRAKSFIAKAAGALADPSMHKISTASGPVRGMSFAAMGDTSTSFHGGMLGAASMRVTPTPMPLAKLEELSEELHDIKMVLRSLQASASGDYSKAPLMSPQASAGVYNTSSNKMGSSAVPPIGIVSGTNGINGSNLTPIQTMTSNGELAQQSRGSPRARQQQQQAATAAAADLVINDV